MKDKSGMEIYSEEDNKTPDSTDVYLIASQLMHHSVLAMIELERMKHENLCAEIRGEGFIYGPSDFGDLADQLAQSADELFEEE